MADDDCTLPSSTPSNLLYTSPHSHKDLIPTSAPNASQPGQLDVSLPAEPATFRSSPVQQQPLACIPLTSPLDYSQSHDSPPEYTPLTLPLCHSQSCDSPPTYSSLFEYARTQHQANQFSQQFLPDSFLALEADEHSGGLVSELQISYHDGVLPVETSSCRDAVPITTSTHHEVVPIATSEASYDRHLRLASFIICWCCLPCGCIAWVLAVVASERALEGRDSIARKLGLASLLCSLLGIVTVVLSILVLIVVFV